jgi:hypothetical protein
MVDIIDLMIPSFASEFLMGTHVMLVSLLMRLLWLSPHNHVAALAHMNVLDRTAVV